MIKFIIFPSFGKVNLITISWRKFHKWYCHKKRKEKVKDICPVYEKEVYVRISFRIRKLQENALQLLCMLTSR